MDAPCDWAGGCVAEADVALVDDATGETLSLYCIDHGERRRGVGQHLVLMPQIAPEMSPQNRTQNEHATAENGGESRGTA